jgi:hypothetical protein
MSLDQEVAKKLSGYKQQDKKHDIFSATFFVSKGDVVNMFAAGAKCTYCLHEVKTDYEAKDKKQWTLDRIDNRMGHNRGNVLLCCLECNLKRGNGCTSEQFRFTKQLRIVCQNKTNDGVYPEKFRWKNVVKSNQTTLDELD